MAAVNKQTIFMTGKLYWAKVIGEPRPNYAGDAREWAFEFEPDEAGLKKVKELKLADRLKDKYEDRGKFLTLKKSELSKDGNPNTPIRLYNEANEEWDGRLIGNGSVADVKLDVRDYGVGKKKGVYPVAIRIKELVEYRSAEFGGMDGDFGGTPDAPKAKTEVLDDLDDDVPFLND